MLDDIIEVVKVSKVFVIIKVIFFVVLFKDDVLVVNILALLKPELALGVGGVELLECLSIDQIGLELEV